MIKPTKNRTREGEREIKERSLHSFYAIPVHTKEEAAQFIFSFISFYLFYYSLSPSAFSLPPLFVYPLFVRSYFPLARGYEFFCRDHICDFTCISRSRSSLHILNDIELFRRRFSRKPKSQTRMAKWNQLHSLSAFQTSGVVFPEEAH